MLVFSQFVNQSDAQTYVRLIPGIEISRVSEGKSYWGYVTDSAYIFSPYFGLNLESKINSFFAIEITTSISRIKINTKDNSFNPIRKLVFNQYCFSVLAGYKLWHNQTISTGPSIFDIPKMYPHTLAGEGPVFKFNGRVFGIVSACRWNYRNLPASILYMHSFNYINIDSGNVFLYLKPFNSLELCVGYQIKLLDKFFTEPRKIDCPGI